MRLIERYRGSLLGLAVGDALGTTLEFKPPGTFNPISDMVGGGPFNLKPGQWTDDTSLALCLAASLTDLKRFDLTDQLHRYVKWYREGYMSSTGCCFDIGNTTSRSLQRFEETGESYTNLIHPSRAGNGSIMRLAPVPLFYSANPIEAIVKAGESSKTTHGARTAVDGCRYLASLIVGAIRGEQKDTLLSPKYCPIKGYWEKKPLVQEINEVASGSYKKQEPPIIRGTGYVVKSLEAALWAFYKSSSFKEGCLLAVNLGDDADTTGAVFGQFAGAFYGENGIPQVWSEKIVHRQKILSLAEKLYRLARA